MDQKENAFGPVPSEVFASVDKRYGIFGVSATDAYILIWAASV